MILIQLQDGVANPLILDSLDTIEIEHGLEYQRLESAVQADSNSVGVVTVNTEELQLAVALGSGNSTVSPILDRGRLNLHTILVDVEGTIAIGNIVLTILTISTVGTVCTISTISALRGLASVLAVDVPVTIVTNLDVNVGSTRLTALTRSTRLTILTRSTRSTGFALLTLSLHVGLLIIDVPVTILNVDSGNSTILSLLSTLTITLVDIPEVVLDGPNSTGSTVSTIGAIGAIDTIGTISSVCTIANLVSLVFAVLGNNDINTASTFGDRCHTLEDTTLLNRSLQLAQRILIRINLSLEVLDVIIVVLTRHEHACRSYKESS